MEDFKKIMRPTCDGLIYREADNYVWCGSMFRHNSSYYMVYSCWNKEWGFGAWVTRSEVCLAKADSIFGEFRFVKRLFGGEVREDGMWHSVHNPTVITVNGRHYMYCVNNYGNGDYWVHRNNQRVGVAWCDDPEGDWTFENEKLIDISGEGIDSLMTSNPTACETPDGRILMIYKAVDKYGTLPKGGKVLCGAAIADHPLGPFEKYGKPIFENPENDWSVEDPFVWCDGTRFYTLVKDFHGYFTKTGKTSWALFESDDGFDWRSAKEPLAYFPELDYGNGDVREVKYLDRPGIYFEDGRPKVLLCAVMELKEESYSKAKETYNIRIPLEG